VLNTKQMNKDFKLQRLLFFLERLILFLFGNVFFLLANFRSVCP
jgi:hypothetical protein